MNSIKKKINLPFALYLVLIGIIGNATAGSAPAQEVSDAKRETQIWTTYELNPYLRDNQLQVSVHGGKVTLTGTVEDAVTKDLAKQIALGVDGVNEVEDKIKVEAGYTSERSNSKERSYGQIIEDASMTAAIKSKLLWGKNTSGFATNVDTVSGKVTLQGTAQSGAAKELAGRMAKNTRGVIHVDNQIKVTEENKHDKLSAAKKSVEEIGEDVSDTWITTKVKSTFMLSNNIESGDISVATKDGIVSLTGKVQSGAESELAIEMARNIRGVKSVQSKGLTF